MQIRYLYQYLMYGSLAAIILSSSAGGYVYAQDRGKKSQVEVIKPTQSDTSPPLRWALVQSDGNGFAITTYAI